MVNRSISHGLIVSTTLQTTRSLEELVACCGWPALLQATPRRLRDALSLRVPELALFWLDDQREVASTLQLLKWLAAHQSTMRRIAIAYRLADDVEMAVRCASAQLYLAADGDIRALVDSSLFQGLRLSNQVPSRLTRRPLPVGASQGRSPLHPQTHRRRKQPP
jgi:hypothetical protein